MSKTLIGNIEIFISYATNEIGNHYHIILSSQVDIFKTIFLVAFLTLMFYLTV